VFFTSESLEKFVQSTAKKMRKTNIFGKEIKKERILHFTTD
jgi:hypothetical protein